MRSLWRIFVAVLRVFFDHSPVIVIPASERETQECPCVDPEDTQELPIVPTNPYRGHRVDPCESIDTSYKPEG